MNLVEAIWLGIGFVTVLYTLGHLGELMRDLDAVRRNGNGNPTLRVVAWAYLRRELIRLFQGLCICVIGLYGAVTPSPLGHDVITVTGIVLTGVLFAMGASTIAQSLWDWRTRHEVIRMLREPQVASGASSTISP